jgi:hypothetical protein
LATFDKHDAETAHRLVRYALSDGGVLSRFIESDEHYGLLLAAQELGLLGPASAFPLEYSSTEDELIVVCHDKKLRIRSDRPHTVNLRVYPLTTYAKDLLKLAGRIPANADYLAMCAEEIKGMGFVVQIEDASPSGQEASGHNHKSTP